MNASVYADYCVKRSVRKKALHQYSHDLLYYSALACWAVNTISSFYNY